MASKQNTILVTGAAGFIGSKTAERFLDRGMEVVGLDNMNDYYDVRLKQYRLDMLRARPGFTFFNVDIEQFDALTRVFEERTFDAVVNLAARAGVRYSIENPLVYLTTNIEGTLNLLEHCRARGITKFVLASTSSLYAGCPVPFQETCPAEHPLSPYAASKKGAEALLYAYHTLHGIDAAVVRYFTVYGPAGRPDMSVFRLIKSIDEDAPIAIFGDGTQSRDFTYIDDIAEGTVRACERATGFEIINLGGNAPYTLNEVIEFIERSLGKKAKRDRQPFHPADMKATWADINKAERLLGWRPQVSLEQGLTRSIEWHAQNRAWLRDIVL